MEATDNQRAIIQDLYTKSNMNELTLIDILCKDVSLGIISEEQAIELYKELNDGNST